MHIGRIVMWVAALFLIGGVAPRLIGAGFYDPHLMVAFAAMAVLFESTMICQAIGEDAGGTHPAAVLYRKIAATAIFGFISALLLMVIRVVASNRELRAPYFVYPDPRVIFGLVVLAAGFAIVGAAAGAVITLYSYSPDRARQRMRMGFLALLLLFIIGARFGPESWRAALTSMLTNDAMPGFAGAVAMVCLALSAWLIRVASRHQQYSVHPPKAIGS
jgi:hypothetical protein